TKKSEPRTIVSGLYTVGRNDRHSLSLAVLIAGHSSPVALPQRLRHNAYLCVGHNTSSLLCVRIRPMPRLFRTNCCYARVSCVNFLPEFIHFCRWVSGSHC